MEAVSIHGKWVIYCSTSPNGPVAKVSRVVGWFAARWAYFPETSYEASRPSTRNLLAFLLANIRLGELGTTRVWHVGVGVKQGMACKLSKYLLLKNARNGLRRPKRA